MGGTSEDNNQPNGVIMVISNIMRNVMSSAEDAECGALFYNAKELKAIRTTLGDMGHPQQATEIIAGNYTADGIMRRTIKPKQTKAMDIGFYWVCD